MVHQVGRLFRHSARGEIAGCSTYDKSISRHAANDQTRIRNQHISDREIEPLFHQINHPVGHRHVDRHVGIERNELGDHGSEERRNCHRRVEAQCAPRRRLQGLGHPFGILDFRENLQAAVIVDLARLGQAHATGAAIEEPHSEPLLKRPNVGRRHAGGYAERPRSRGEAFALDHLHEGGHAGHPVHAITRSAPGRHVPEFSPYQVVPDHVYSRLSVERRREPPHPLLESRSTLARDHRDKTVTAAPPSTTTHARLCSWGEHAEGPSGNCGTATVCIQKPPWGSLALRAAGPAKPMHSMMIKPSSVGSNSSTRGPSSGIPKLTT